MARRFLLCSSFLSALLLALLAVAGPGRAQQALNPPTGILSLASGGSVHLAWQLPGSPRPHGVIIYRANKAVGVFALRAQVKANVLTLVDSEVTLGETYLYRLASYRGQKLSDYSPVIEVAVGGNSRIAFLGGTRQRAVFEVTLYAEGRRFAETFVQAVDEPVGDLRYVESLSRTLDFRLGPLLIGLSLGYSEGDAVLREKILDREGRALKDAGGRDVELEFRVPAERREILTATLKLADGSEYQLAEGRSLIIE